MPAPRRPPPPAAVASLTPGRLGGIALGAVALSLAAAIGLGPLGLAGVVLAPVIGFALPPLLIAHPLGGARAVLGLHRPAPRALLGAALIGASMWLLTVTVLAPLLVRLPDREATEQALAPLADGDLPLLVRVALFALMPAVTEELLCRGLLCRNLAPRLGATAAVALSTLYFAALHMSLTQGVPALVTGAACGAVTLATGSTVAAIVLHALNNASIIVVSDGDLGLGPVLEANAALALASAAAATALGVSLIRRGRGSDSVAERLP